MNKIKTIIYSVLVLVIVLFAFAFLPGLQGVDAAWYSSGGVWTNRKVIAVDYQKVPGSQTNFPMLFSVIDSHLKSTGNGGLVGQTDGGDILFTWDNGATKLSHEIEKYDATTGELVAWVNIPYLSSTSTTYLHIYYGDDDVANQADTADGSNDVWDSIFKGVWHLKEDPSTTCATTKEICDSTANAVNGDANGSMNSGDQVAGQIGGSIEFDASDDYIDFSAISVTDHTISGWFYFNTDTCNWASMVGAFSATVANDADYGFDLKNTGTLRLWKTDNLIVANSTLLLKKRGWVYIVGSYDQDDGSTNDCGFFYFDGVLDSTSCSSTSITSTHSFKINKNWDGSNWPGKMDEIRISSTPRSATWIRTEYNNQSSPGTFYSYSGQEQENKTVTSGKVRGGGTTNLTQPSVKSRGGVNFR